MTHRERAQFQPAAGEDAVPWGAWLDVDRACTRYLQKRGIRYDNPIEERWAARVKQRHAARRARA